MWNNFTASVIDQLIVKDDSYYTVITKQIIGESVMRIFIQMSWLKLLNLMTLFVRLG